jgi:hypothetical protein
VASGPTTTGSWSPRSRPHVERNHPEMVGRLSRDDVLGMAEEE